MESTGLAYRGIGAKLLLALEAAGGHLLQVQRLLDGVQHGVMHLGRFVDEEDDRAQRMIDINVNGVLYGMKEAMPLPSTA